jgi:hypothetical protein
MRSFEEKSFWMNIFVDADKMTSDTSQMCGMQRIGQRLILRSPSYNQTSWRMGTGRPL